MPTQTAYHVAASGNDDLYVYPMANVTFDGWDDDKVALVETYGAGLYSADLSDLKGHDWGVFDGASAPTDWNARVGTVSLSRLVLLSPFLDEPVPSDWILRLTDRSGDDEVDRVLEVKPGERYMAALDCQVAMAKQQPNLYQFDLPTTPTSWLSIVPTTDLALPQHGKAGKLVKWQFEVSESATSGASGSIDLVVWPSQYSRLNPTVTIVVE